MRPGLSPILLPSIHSPEILLISLTSIPDRLVFPTNGYAFLFIAKKTL